MSYIVEEINGCTKKLTFNFETLDLTEEMNKALTEKRKNASLKGFRKGKAPLSVVEKIYGREVETDALNKFIQGKLYEAIESEDLRVVGYPSFENMNYDSGKSVSFDALVEIFPVVEIKDMSGLSFTKDKVEVTDEDVDGVVKNYLNPKVEMVEVTDESATLEKGQTAILNFQGEKEDGEKPENMKGDDFSLEIGSGQFIPGFEDGMIGMKKNEKKTIALTFPEDYQAEDLQGAKVDFHVELLEIKEKKYPELTDDLAVEFGFENVEDFKTKNRKNLEMQNEKRAKEKLHQEILEKLIEENTFDVPNALLVQQENHLKEDLKGTLAQQGFNQDMMEEYFSKWKGDLTTKALFQVKSGLILDTLRKNYNIEAGDAEFDAKLGEIAATTGMEVDHIKEHYLKDKNMKQNLMYAIKEEKTFEEIAKVVTIVEK